MGIPPFDVVKLVLFDVDGVLTNGDIYVDADGEIFKQFNVKDGVAVSLLKKHNIQTGVISGKHSDALLQRCNQLKFDYVVTGCHTKRAALDELLVEANLLPDQVVFVGDDVIDLEVMRYVGLSYTPADGHQLVKESSTYILDTPGGKGVARAVAEHVLLGRGLSLDEVYKPLLSSWSTTEVVQ